MKNEIVHSASTKTEDNRSDTPLTDHLMHLLAGSQLTMPTLLKHAKQMERDRAELIEALQNLVTAEEEYGDGGNAAVNAAWHPALTLLQRIKAKP